jgi:hypothetical protein
MADSVRGMGGHLANETALSQRSPDLRPIIVLERLGEALLKLLTVPRLLAVAGAA